MNISKFIGIVTDINNFSIITEYCNKGSLNDVLMNEEIPLNWGFRFVLRRDSTTRYYLWVKTRFCCYDWWFYSWVYVIVIAGCRLRKIFAERWNTFITTRCSMEGSRAAIVSSTTDGSARLQVSLQSCCQHRKSVLTAFNVLYLNSFKQTNKVYGR